MMNNAKHPLQIIREKHKLTQFDMALMSDTYQPTISAIEMGKAEVDSRVLSTIEAMGYNSEKFLKKHEAYKKIKRAKLLEKVAGGDHETE